MYDQWITLNPEDYRCCKGWQKDEFLNVPRNRIRILHPTFRINNLDLSRSQFELGGLAVAQPELRFVLTVTTGGRVKFVPAVCIFPENNVIGWSTVSTFWKFVIIVFHLISRWENTLKHNITLLTSPWPSPFALILIDVHLRNCSILKRKMCDTYHEITWLLRTHKKLNIWNCKQQFVINVFHLKSRWENTLKHNITLLTCPWSSPFWLILIDLHLRNCYILKCKICDTYHEITWLLKHVKQMKL